MQSFIQSFIHSFIQSFIYSFIKKFYTHFYTKVIYLKVGSFFFIFFLFFYFLFLFLFLLNILNRSIVIYPMCLFVFSNTIVFLLFVVFCFISGGSRRIFVQSLNGKAVFFRLFGFDSQLNNYLKKCV